MTLLRRLAGEVTLWANAVAALVGVLVTFNLHWLTPLEAAAVVGGVNALAAIVVAWKARPVAPALWTGAWSAAAALLVAYGLHLSDVTVGAVNVLVLAVAAGVTRLQVTPVARLSAGGHAGSSGAGG